MKLDDANIHGREPMACISQKEMDERFSDAFQRIERAAWEACARSFGHKDEAEIMRKFLEWRQE